MIAANPTALLVLFIAIALLAHICNRLFTPFRQVARITGEPGYFVIYAEDVEVRSVVKFQIFNALKWAAIGVTAAILVF